MQRVLNFTVFSLIVGLTSLTALSGCGQNPPPSPAKGAVDPPAHAVAPKGSVPPTNDPVWHASGGKSTLDSISTTAGPKDNTEELLKATPDAVLKEGEFAEGMKKDSKYLHQYDGKIVDITGKLKHYSFSNYVDGYRPEFMLDSLKYKYSCRDPNALARVAPEQTVTLRARCDIYVGFTRCVIVKVEGDPPAELVADTLAEAYAADEKATENKYKGKYVVLKGIARIIKEKPFVQVALTSPGVKPEVVCHLLTESSEMAIKQGWLKEGAEVRILCSSSLGDPSFGDAVVRGPLK